MSTILTSYQPEKRGNWYTMLDRIKKKEEELLPDETARMGRKR